MNTDLVMILAAMVGTFVHWVKEKYTGQTVGSPIDYLVTHPWNTLSMFGATFATCATLLATGSMEHATLTNAVMTGFGIGYAADSALNKGPKQ